MQSEFAAGWRQVLACLLMMAASAMLTSAYGVIAVPLGEEFRPSRTVTMLAMTIISLVSAVLAPIVGPLLDRVSLRLMMGIGAGAIMAGFVALSFVTSFTQVLVIYGLFMAPGMMLGGPMPATVLLSRWFQHNRGAALGIAMSGISLGGFAYPPIVQLLLDTFEWREALRMLALVVAVTVVPATLLVSSRGPAGQAVAGGAQSADERAPLLTTRQMLADPTFWLLSAIMAITMAGMMGMVTSLVPVALDEGIAPGPAALLISVFAGCGLIAKLSFAALADRLSPRILLLLGIGGFTAGMTCLIGAEAGYWLIAVGVGLMGLFAGMLTPMPSLLVPRIYGPRVVGKVLGAVNLAMLGALLATPPVFGLSADLTGNYDAVFAGFAALGVMAMLMVPYIRLQPGAGEATPAGLEKAGIA